MNAALHLGGGLRWCLCSSSERRGREGKREGEREGGREEGSGGREGGREEEKRKKVRGREEGREEKEARDKGFRRYNCTILCLFLLLTNERKESGVVVRHNKKRHVGEATAGLEVAE